MNKRQIIQHAKNYMDLLAKGIDPISQNEIASIAAEPRLRKCFSFVSGILEELLANDGYVALSTDDPEAPPNESAPQYELVRKKAAFQLSREQRRKVFIDNAPITPTAFINHINRVVDGESMEKLSIRRINAWLLKNAYIAETKQPAVINRTVMKPLPKAAGIGISEEETVDPKTGEIKSRIVLTRQAQQFLLDNLDQILSPASGASVDQ